MDVNGYTIDRVTPAELPEDEQIALARLFQRMSKEIVPEDPERPLDAILARIRATSPNEWHARVRARDTKGSVVAWAATSRSLNDPENAHVTWTEVSVHPDHRRKGLGRAVFAELVAAADGQHPELLFMGMTNDRAPGGELFLEKIGAQAGLPMKTNQLVLADVDRAKVAEWAKLAPAGYRLERADNVARALNLLGHLLEVDTAGEPGDDGTVRWLALLRSCGSAEAYSRYYSLRVEPANQGGKPCSFFVSSGVSRRMSGPYTGV